MNRILFGGPILSIHLNTSSNSTTNTNSSDSGDGNDDQEYDDDDSSENSGRFVMTDQNPPNEQQEPSRTTYTTVTYTKLDTGLSITISETITITNTHDKSPITNKNYELILVPSIENTKTIVVPTNETNDKPLSPPLPSSQAAAAVPPLPPATTVTTARITKSPSHHQFLQSNKSKEELNFAYIDESSDDRTFSSGEGTI